MSASPGMSAPSIQSFTAAEVGGSTASPCDSLQVPEGAQVVLSWKASYAPDGFELVDRATGISQSLPAGTASATVQPAAELNDYELFALADGARSLPSVVHVSTHAEGQVVSGHAQVSSPAAGTRTIGLQLNDDEGQPRAAIPFTLQIGMAQTQGTTGAQGQVSARFTSGATEATLTLHAPGGDEAYQLTLGLAPASSTLGAQQRLAMLGYSCTPSGALDDATKSALQSFQQEQKLPASGALDAATQQRLAQAAPGND